MSDQGKSVPQRHPSLFEPATLILIAVLSVFGAIIGLQLLVSLGVTANTSLIGVPFLLGRQDLVVPMFVGAFLAMLLDAFLIYRMFDSRVFPATSAWSPGVAAAEAIKAGDEGGRKAVLMGVGFGTGILASFIKIPLVWIAFARSTAVTAVPMSAFIGTIWALTMFGIGLLLRSYSGLIFNNSLFAGFIPKGDLVAAYISLGFMTGAGIVALLQVVLLLVRRDDATKGGCSSFHAVVWLTPGRRPGSMLESRACSASDDR